VSDRPDLEAIRQAHARIGPHIHRTPVLTCEHLNSLAAVELYFKCENFQKAGVFKSRGACNAVFSLESDQAAKGVATHSSGNHAAALARAAALRQIAAHIVMPSNSPETKVAAVRHYGGNITFCEPTQEAREKTADKVVAETGATLIHPYNNNEVIAGQGTAALELLQQVPDLDVVMVPVGGGGLLSGTLIATKQHQPSTLVIAAEPLGADDAFRSWKSGTCLPMPNPQTIADGLRTSLGELTFPIICDLVDDIWLADEESIVSTLRLVMQRMKIVIEPSSAVPLAALLAHDHHFAGKKVGVILSGGNVDLDKL